MKRKHSVSGNREESGVVGLDNLDNTCFMSAGVQCLMATAPLVVSLHETRPSFPLQNSDIRFGLANLARTMWRTRLNSLRPTRFMAKLVRRYPQFDDNRQHDCQEFLALLLDALHEEMNTVQKKNSTSLTKSLESPNNRHILENSNDQSTSYATEEIMPDDLKMNHSEILDNSPATLSCSMRAQGDKIFTGESPMAVDGENHQTMTIKNVFNPGDSGQSQYALDTIKIPETSNDNFLVTVFVDLILTSIPSFSGEELIKALENLKKLKSAKLHNEMDEDKNVKLDDERHLKHVDQFLLDTNQRMENEIKESCREYGVVSLNNEPEQNIKIVQTTDPEADAHWRAHLAANRSVIIDTFQGQFKSTVVCSLCRYVSVTYEPFMYLSVPLPKAVQRPIRVTYVSEPSTEPSVFTLELNRYDDVRTLKKRVEEKIEGSPGPLIVAEVEDHHVAKILDDDYLVKLSNVSKREIYAFKVPSEGSTETEFNEEDKSCATCFDEKQTKRHDECSWSICDDCLASWRNNSDSVSVECPSCKNMVQPESFETFVKPDDQTVRFILVSLLFRVDSFGDGNNNQKSVVPFGHPRILRVPNICSSEELYKIVNESNPFQSSSPKLLLVGGKGYNCSRCIYTSHCRGCEVPTNSSEICIWRNDSLALTFASMPAPYNEELWLQDKSEKKQHKMLTIYDCIETFSKSEQLDGNNPWYCTKCQEPRCATKSLTIWRYPDYLVVYLKRFVFHDGKITKLKEKVIFPLNDLHFPSADLMYDLYACVCHKGGVYSGHYTTYAQHPYSGEWHYFNDSSVVKRAPQDDDFSKAYILFYRRQGNIVTFE